MGPIARTVDDAALLLSACAGPDARDPFSLMLPIGDEPAPDRIRDLRVAFSPTLGYARVDGPVAAAVAEAVKKLEAVFSDVDLVERVCPNGGEILAAEFIGGCSARLGDSVDSTPKLIEPPEPFVRPRRTASRAC